MLPDAAILTTLASPRRREILRLVWQDELAASAVHRAMPDVTFGAVSLHLKALREAGLVVSRKDSRQRFYKANRDGVGPIAAVLEAMWEDALWRLKLAAELEETRRGPRPSSRRRVRRTVRKTKP